MFIVDCFLIRSTREVWSVITGKTSLNDPVRSIVYFVKFRHSCLDETLPHYLQFLEHSDFFHLGSGWSRATKMSDIVPKWIRLF